MSARLRLLLLTAVLAGCGSFTTLSFAYWTGFKQPVAGVGDSRATSLNPGPRPVVSVDNAAGATVTWAPSSTSDGNAVDGYRLVRYASDTHELQTIGSGCSGVRLTQSCTELSVPVGSWTYAVTPVLGTNWQGDEGPESAPAVVSAKQLTLARSIFGASLPATTTGTVTGFLPNETITYEFDGQPAAGSPGQVDGSGAASITSLVIPASAADGWHDVTVVGGALPTPSRAVASVLVDSIAPTVSPMTIPPPNAAGWNNTSPVQVNAVYGDGAGSGLAAIMYTTDGSDPTTSPTVQAAIAPLDLSVTTTVRYYAIDVAGNESVVGTHEVRIDTQPPYYLPAVNVTEGGAYFSVTGAYYRGVDAGRMTIVTTVMDEPGGSGPAYAATPDLTGLTEGFSHVSSSVSTPEGGPYVSNEVSWIAGTHSQPHSTMTVADRAGNIMTMPGALVDDSAPPTGGTVDVTGLAGTDGRYATTRTLAVVMTPGTDALSGLSGIGSRLERATAVLESGACGTYGSYAQVGFDDPVTPILETVPSDLACYRYRYRVQDHVGNWATYESPDIKVSADAPLTLRPSGISITPVSGTGGQYVSGTTIYINPTTSGSFRVEADASDVATRVARLEFPSPLGLSGGGVVSSEFAPGRYRSTYAWVAPSPAASPGVQSLSATNDAGQVMADPSAFDVRIDVDGPVGGSITAPDLVDGIHSASTSVRLALAAGADGGSGIAAAGARLWRASAPLSSPDGIQAGTCGVFGSYTEVAGAGSVASLEDDVPADATCYRYRYHAVDRVGNVSISTSIDIQVDTTPPSAPSLALSDTSASWWSTPAQTLFYRVGAASGGFTFTATATDLADGIAAYEFPVLSPGWSFTELGFGVRRYTWLAANPTPMPGPHDVVAFNEAGLRSTSRFHLVPDALSPSGGSVTYTNGYVTQSSMTIGGSLGSDVGSGLATASSSVTRQVTALNAGSCGAFSGPLTTSLPAGPPYVDTGLASGSCYRYTLTAFDMVGNTTTYVSSSIAKVDYVGPTHTLTIASAVNASMTGSNVYYRGNVAGSFRLGDTLADSSLVTSATFPGVTATGWTHAAETISTPSGGPYASSTYSWTGTTSTPGAYAVTATDDAGNVGAQPLNFVKDITNPVGGSITYPNALTTATTVPLTTVLGTDSLSGLAAAGSSYERSVAKLNGSDSKCGVFGAWLSLLPVAGVDTDAPAGWCYRYRFTVLDKVGNAAVYTSTNVARVT